MSTLEAASYQRAFGQSHYLKLDPVTLKTSATQIDGLEATLIQSDKRELLGLQPPRKFLSSGTRAISRVARATPLASDLKFHVLLWVRCAKARQCILAVCVSVWLIKMSRHDRKLEAGFLEERLRDMDYQRAQETYKNRLCVTVHKPNLYRIVSITDQTADSVTFEKGGTTMTVAQYFKDTYGESVEGKQLVEAKQARGGSGVVYLPVNLLRIIAQAPPVGLRS